MSPENPLHIEYFIPHTEEGRYLTLPFQMPAGTETFSLTYRYERHHESESGVGNGRFISRQEINIIDLGLIAPEGTQVGASGSDKTEIQVSETDATPGYHPHVLTSGEWRILVGAYKVAPAGVTVSYDLTFTPKRLRTFKGDLHLHTYGSDGVLSAEELAQHARRHGLDFLAITDHNKMASSESLPKIPGITLIPGVEWTHFKGHATFLGVDKPYDEPFYTNSPKEIQKRFESASRRGALIAIDHPFDEVCPFTFDMNSLPFDCLEIWNGPMRESNLRAIGLWQGMLNAGKKVPISGGSDYHRSQLFLYPGGPTTCIQAMSAGMTDILSGLRLGHSYITFAPDGPSLEMSAGVALPGDSVLFPKVKEMQVKVRGLQAGDILQVVTKSGPKPILQAATNGGFDGEYKVEEAGFARIEILRGFVPGLPLLPTLVSSPIYFENNI